LWFLVTKGALDFSSIPGREKIFHWLSREKRRERPSCQPPSCLFWVKKHGTLKDRSMFVWTCESVRICGQFVSACDGKCMLIRLENIWDGSVPQPMGFGKPNASERLSRSCDRLAQGHWRKSRGGFEFEATNKSWQVMPMSPRHGKPAF